MLVASLIRPPRLSKYGPNIWEPPDVPEPDHRSWTSTTRAMCPAFLKACALYLSNQSHSLPTWHAMATPSSGSFGTHRSEDAEPSACVAARRYQPHYTCEATEGGLELLQRDGTWRRSCPGQTSSMPRICQNLTNGILKETTHRVVNPDNNRSRRFDATLSIRVES